MFSTATNTPPQAVPKNQDMKTRRRHRPHQAPKPPPQPIQVVVHNVCLAEQSTAKKNMMGTALEALSGSVDAICQRQAALAKQHEAVGKEVVAYKATVAAILHS